MENSGGYLVGRKNGKIYIHNDGSLGGFLVGRRHATGGIKGHNHSTGQPIEVEGGEIQVISKAVQDDRKRPFMGKMMTNKEILSYLNVEGGGVSFAEGGAVEIAHKNSTNVADNGAGEPIQYKGGEVILTRGAVSSDKKYSFNGKNMTTREIASAINTEHGGVSFMDGGNVKKEDKVDADYFGKQLMERGMSKKEIDDLVDKYAKKEMKEHKLDVLEFRNGEITIEQLFRRFVENHLKENPDYYMPHSKK